MSTEADKQERVAEEPSRKPSKAQMRARRGKSSKGRLGVGPILMLGGVLVLGAVFYFSNRPSGEAGPKDKYAFKVGEPGPGKDAPPVELPAVNGGTFSLAALQGKNVLLYFQEGLMCQPCWDQLKAIEGEWGKFQALGIDQIATITTDTLGGLRQKVRDEGLTTTLLSDESLAVSRSYDTTSYGMMGSSFNGHTFILVGPDGKIRWRADYGGPPNFTMYLPVSKLLSDLTAGLKT